MKIIQLNIWGGKLGEQIIDFLQAEKPDFVCMQEVNDLKGQAGYKFFATLEEIKTGAGFSDSFMSAAYSSRYMERELEYGNAILSKLPMLNSKTIFTCGRYKRNFDITQEDGNIRNLQLVEVEIGDARLHILNHHGYHINNSKSGNSETLRQMRLIADTIDSIDGPIIMCGDFNLAPDSQSIGIINDRLTNLSIAHKLKCTYTQLSAVDKVCDYIFVNEQIKVRDFVMSEEILSDHKALVMEFDLAN